MSFQRPEISLGRQIWRRSEEMALHDTSCHAAVESGRCVMQREQATDGQGLRVVVGLRLPPHVRSCGGLRLPPHIRPCGSRLPPHVRPCVGTSIRALPKLVYYLALLPLLSPLLTLLVGLVLVGQRSNSAPEQGAKRLEFGRVGHADTGTGV
jgi:hypothetical protein